jgi:hypothetical protein
MLLCCLRLGEIRAEVFGKWCHRNMLLTISVRHYLQISNEGGESYTAKSFVTFWLKLDPTRAAESRYTSSGAHTVFCIRGTLGSFNRKVHTWSVWLATSPCLVAWLSIVGFLLLLPPVRVPGVVSIYKDTLLLWACIFYPIWSYYWSVFQKNPGWNLEGSRFL